VIQNLLKDRQESLLREQWRMKQLEDNRARLHEKMMGVEAELHREKFSPVGIPRHLEEELADLKRVSSSIGGHWAW